MQKAIRKQTDGKGDEFSRRTRKSFIGTVDLARQEFKDEQDINKMLARYGVPQALAAQRATTEEVNFDMDLQQALHNIRETRAAFNRLPQHLREKYSTWQQLLAALDRGEVVNFNKEDRTDGGAPEAENQQGVSSGPAAGSSNGHD